MGSEEYIALNKASWDERAPAHARAPGYAFEKLLKDPNYLSDVVAFDIPLMGDISGLEKVVHLQCHIGTDTISLARRGAKYVVGLDFSSASIAEGRRLAANAAGGERLSFVEASLYEAPDVLEKGSFDMVFTGIGSLCWLPNIRQWAEVVHSLLKPGGRFFIREGHPMMWSLDEKVKTHLEIRYPYFERTAPMEFEDEGTYITLAEEDSHFQTSKTQEWNHGLGEVIQSLLDVGMVITGLVEHKSLPWEALPGQMVEAEYAEFALKGDQDRLPLSYTLQAVKKG